MAKFGKKTKNLLKIVGPGSITGAADDDPSGIATYTQTGAQFGYGQAMDKRSSCSPLWWRSRKHARASAR